MDETAPGPLPAIVRRERMLRVIDERGFARVSELSEMFGVSEVTVRSDLDALERGGEVSRIHGGAVPRARSERSFEEGLESAADEKRAIAASAAGQLEPGMTVLLDVGTTTAAVASAIVSRVMAPDDALAGLTVVTNGLANALALESAIPRLTVIVTGGTLRPLQHSLVAPLASVLLERVRADVAFIGCTGVHPAHGVTNVNLPESELKRAMLDASSRAYALAGIEKIGRTDPGRIGRMDEFAGLITGADVASAPAGLVEALRAETDVIVSAE
jgi:DeoR family transcriptional regulator of aga operon